jgi:catechol 2,3-dioxygenase-like lactoylglutathione lyase family enzyme
VGDMTIELVTFVVKDYDEAIEFFVGRLGFALIEDSPSVAESGRAKRWVVVRPPGGGTGLLLAEADGDEQRRAVGNQTGGRVAFFLRVDDFGEAYERMRHGGVEFLTEPREEPYGSVAIFRDISGNRWDLLGPPPAP